MIRFGFNVLGLNIECIGYRKMFRYLFFYIKLLRIVYV